MFWFWISSTKIYGKSIGWFKLAVTPYIAKESLLKNLILFCDNDGKRVHALTRHFDFFNLIVILTDLIFSGSNLALSVKYKTETWFSNFVCLLVVSS